MVFPSCKCVCHISGHPCEKENLYLALHLLQPFLYLSHSKFPWREAQSSVSISIYK